MCVKFIQFGGHHPTTSPCPVGTSGWLSSIITRQKTAADQSLIAKVLFQIGGKQSVCEIPKSIRCPKGRGDRVQHHSRTSCRKYVLGDVKWSAETFAEICNQLSQSYRGDGSLQHPYIVDQRYLNLLTSLRRNERLKYDILPLRRYIGFPTMSKTRKLSL